MNKLIKKLVIATLIGALGIGAAQASTAYNFSYLFAGKVVGGGTTVTGTFMGDANGNLISNLTNISVAVNGVNFLGNGSLFGSSLDTNTGNWRTGGAVVSFDGTENNFLFVDTNYPDEASMINFFYSISAWDQITTFSFATGLSASDSPVETKNWSVTQANNVPEPDSMLLLGAGLAGLFFRRRQASR